MAAASVSSCSICALASATVSGGSAAAGTLVGTAKRAARATAERPSSAERTTALAVGMEPTCLRLDAARLASLLREVTRMTPLFLIFPPGSHERHPHTAPASAAGLRIRRAAADDSIVTSTPRRRNRLGHDLVTVQTVTRSPASLAETGRSARRVRQ